MKLETKDITKFEEKDGRIIGFNVELCEELFWVRMLPEPDDESDEFVLRHTSEVWMIGSYDNMFMPRITFEMRKQKESLVKIAKTAIFNLADYLQNNIEREKDLIIEIQEKLQSKPEIEV